MVHAERYENEASESYGQSVSLHLDADGNANVGLIAGPDCFAGESLITLDENESPYETFTTSFTVLPPVNTTQGVYSLPSSQVEDAESSAVVTLVQAEFAGGSESYVRIGPNSSTTAAPTVGQSDPRQLQRGPLGVRGERVLG